VTDRALPEPAFPPASPDPADDLVTVLMCATEFEAATRVAVLNEAGIEAFSFGGVQAALPLQAKFLQVPVQVRAGDFDRAKAVLEENTIVSASVDWDSVDVGEREDHLPLHAPGRMPWPARIGFVLAMVVLATMLAGIAWSAVVAVLSKW
jgi:hypothetical protein